jgi:hypothetical protein
VRLALALATLLALAAPAAAQTTVDLGSGTQPAVALDAAGTAYIAWVGVEPNVTSLHLCRLPRNASACDINQAIAVPGTSLSRPFVIVDGSTVRILSYRYGLQGSNFDEIYKLTSTDGGATFDAGIAIGRNPFYDAVRGPGGASYVSTIANNSGNFQRVYLDATGANGTIAALTGDHPYSPSLALTDPSSLLAVFADGSGAAQFRTFNNTDVDPNVATNWAPAQDFAAVAHYMRLAAGPNGVYLLSDNADGFQEVRRYGVGSFSAPVVIPGPTKELSGGTHDLTQDGAGRLHAVWPFNDGSGFHVGYATSDDGASWKTGRFDVADPNDLSKHVEGMRLAVNTDHLGVAAFDNGSGSGAIVRAVALGPEPPVPAPTPTPTPAPSPTPTPTPFTPTPSLGRAVTAEPVKGTVLVKPPGASKYTKLTALGSVPVGSSVDTRKGTIRINSASNRSGGVQTGLFFDGLFVVRQKTATKPVTDLVLSGRFRCPKARTATAAAKPKKIRRLWGNGKGRFRTSGKFASATVRGTVWEVADRCDGTLVTVKSGSVSVRDTRRRRTVVVKARRSYLARARSR